MDNTQDQNGGGTFEEQLQSLIDEMRTETGAAYAVYDSRPDKENPVMPVAFGEALGYSKALQTFGDKLQTLLIQSGEKGLAAFRSSQKKAEEISEEA